MYDDRLRGVISEELFVRKYASCVAEEETLEAQLRPLQRGGQGKPIDRDSADDIILHLDKRILTKELARTLLTAFWSMNRGASRKGAICHAGGTPSAGSNLRRHCVCGKHGIFGTTEYHTGVGVNWDRGPSTCICQDCARWERRLMIPAACSTVGQRGCGAGKLC